MGINVTNPIIVRMLAIAVSKGVPTLTKLASVCGLSSTTLTKHANATTSPSVRTLRQVAKHLGCRVEDFLVDEPGPQPQAAASSGKPVIRRRSSQRADRKELPVRGTAFGSALNGFEISPNVIEYVDRPPGLEGVDDAYAIYVVGDSMIPRHNPGELRFIHPYRMYKAGDSIIIQIKNHQSAPIEAYIKAFKRVSNDDVVAEQYNPQATLQYRKNTIYAIHKVMTENELFGV